MLTTDVIATYLPLWIMDMNYKKSQLTSFSHAVHSDSICIRPENPVHLQLYLESQSNLNVLARGAGQSYNDSCLNHEGYVIDTQRFNHFIDFNEDAGVVICEGNVPLKDLFLLHPDFIPPVIPGSVNVTVAGGIAHDIHGKNNHLAGSFGQHILWLEILVNHQIIRCSREEHGDLFKATIAGMGLTGIITKVALSLKKSPRFIQAENKKFDSLQALVHYMSTHGLNNDYQAAWMDLVNPSFKSILFMGRYSDPIPIRKKQVISIPKIPFSLVYEWNIKLFNTLYYQRKKSFQTLSLEQFNNPLDAINHWNRLYGPKGLVQFQAVFPQQHAVESIEHLTQIITQNRATPTLSVLKHFIQSGEGYLSFCKPGFTLAIDFIHNQRARLAIEAMNEYIAEINGQVYLAKDLYLKPNQFQIMYRNHREWLDILDQYQCSMRSNLSQRLGITQ